MTASSTYLKKIRFNVSKKINTAFIGQYRSAFKGNGLLFDTIREYQMGDDVKNIDWKVSARMNHLYVKQYQEERELNIVVMIDFSGSMDFGSQRTKKDVLMELSALLLFLAEYTNDRVSVLLFTDHVEWYFKPKRGRRYVLKVLNDIIHYKPKNRKTDINGALEYLIKVTKKRSVVFMISDFIDQAYETQLKRVVRKHDFIPVVISDPQESRLSFFGLASFYDLESDKVLYATETRREDLNLKQYGLEPLNLSTDRVVEHDVLEFFKKRNRKRLHR
ncbi:MAG: DUF58 domain-containing protein [Spirochaetes bacterium]|jgi:uncharacterized protein (DUF58 family)|nr:DUF58 domain-containing protein [Spirochaetota bacterium]